MTQYAPATTRRENVTRRARYRNETRGEGMNAYIIDAGEYEVTEYIDAELGGPRYTYHAISVIVAETRGQAKSIFFQDPDIRHAFEFTSPMRIRRVGIGVDEPKGETNDFALWQCGVELLRESGGDEIYEWLGWESVGDIYYDKAQR